MELSAAERVARARYNRSARTRRDWVRYLAEVESIRQIASVG